MRPAVSELLAYYGQSQGQRLVGLLGATLTPLMASRKSDRVLGLGYAAPYLQGLRPQVERLVLAHPQLQGATPWPAGQPNCSVQVDEYALPFADALFDQVVAIHVLEFSDPVRRLLREIWRVLAPRGRLLLVVPNRFSLMALLDSSPFGNGRPFSAAQLQQVLKDALFDVRAVHGVAALPHGLGGAAVDRLVLRFAPSIAGLHVVVAQKTDSVALIGTPRRVRAFKPAHQTGQACKEKAPVS